MLDQDYVRNILFYDPWTGEFIWKVNKAKRIQKGQKAGCKSKHGYWVIRIDGILYKAHILAWYYMTGEWPEEIDHHNLIRDDTSFGNLRLATRSQNLANRNKNKNNNSGYKGVYWYARDSKWYAQIYLDYKCNFLECFDKLEDAARAYNKKAIEFYGEYARLNEISL